VQSDNVCLLRLCVVVQLTEEEVNALHRELPYLYAVKL
jgi:hypothetical protein